jgi:hypothetical protein
VERYGYFDRGTLHFAVRNTAEQECRAQISVDAGALAISMDETLRARDLTTQRPVPINITEETVRFSLQIPAGETRVVHLAGSRGCWLMALELMRRGIDRIERYFWKQTRSNAEMLNEVLTAKEILAHLRSSFDTNPADLENLTRDISALYGSLEALRYSINVSGTINRDKMFYRIFDEFSAGPAELLGLKLQLPNDWPAADKGSALDVIATIRNNGNTEVTDIRFDLECPFPNASLKVHSAPTALRPGDSKQAVFRFAFAQSTPRVLAPVLIGLTAQRDGVTSTIYRVLDIRLLNSPIEKSKIVGHGLGQ